MSQPMKITAQVYDLTISVEKDHSDVPFDDYCEMLQVITRGIGYAESQTNALFGDCIISEQISENNGTTKDN